MNSIHYVRLLPVLLIIVSYAQAQTSVEYGLGRQIRISAPGFKQYNDIEGSPYIPGDSVQNGWLQNGTKRIPIQLRYNSYSGEAEYLQDKRLLVPPASVAEFGIVSGDTLIFRKGFPAVDSRSINDFYQVLFDGQKTKLVRHTTSSVKSNTDPMHNDFGKKRFEKREEYYVWVAASQPPSDGHFLKLSDGTMKSVANSKKSLLALFSQQTEPVNRYLSDQKIKLKSWTEFASVLKYMETQ